MANRGLVMTKSNVLALLDDRKFRTMRLIKNIHIEYIENTDITHWAPYQVGDRLYVKEGYQITQENVNARSHGVFYVSHYGKYLADNKAFEMTLTSREYKLWKARTYLYRKTSGRFMYKSLARIWMTVTKVSVERPQDLTEEDAHAEGICDTGREVKQAGRLVMEYPSYEKAIRCTSATASFSTLWNFLHGDGAWERNEWCFVYHWREIEVTNG